MEWERRCIRTCACVLCCAVALRLFSGGALAALDQPQVASFLVYLQTGRVVRLTARQEPVTEILPTVPVETEPVQAPVFTDSDLELVEMKYSCGYRPDLAQLLNKPLGFDLQGDEPTVLILHTHTTESYTPVQGESYEEAGEFRTLEEEHNMLRVGDTVAQKLEEAGICVIHDRQLHDYPSYNDAYNQAAASTAEYLEQYPSIRLILDLHRDAAETAYGQMATECSVGGQQAAQLMFVVGTDENGLSHPFWQENLSLALKLQVTLEHQNPGICRNMVLTRQRYNQHFTTGTLLVEVGAAGNTMDEALLAANELAEAIIALFLLD